MAFPTGWGRKCALVIQNEEVDDTLLNFPLLLTEDTLPSEMFDADGSYPALNGGGDIRFSSDVDGETRLSCEIVSFVTDNEPDNGTAEIWVKVPSVATGTDTTIYVWYNKSGETQPASDAAYGSEDVWSNDYSMVHHLQETTGTHIDSTGNGIDGTVSGATMDATGKIGGGDSFDGGDHIDLGTSLSPTTGFSVSAWVNASAVSSDKQIISKGYDGTNTQWELKTTSVAGKVSFRGWIGSAIGVESVDDLDVDEWTHITGSYDGTTWKIYWNGVLDNSAVSGSPIATTRKLIIGGVDTGSILQQWVGSLDELRIYSRVLPVEWIAAEFSNQNDPSGFVVAGTPQSPTTIIGPFPTYFRI